MGGEGVAGEAGEAIVGGAERVHEVSLDMKTLDDAPYLDMFGEAFQADPAPVIEELRAESWLVRTPVGGLVIRRDQVQALLADRRLRSSVPDIVRMQGVIDGVLHERLASSLLAIEGADHTRVRRLVNRAFTPRAIDPHRPACGSC